jgi:hypothetical protein
MLNSRKRMTVKKLETEDHEKGREQEKSRQENKMQEKKTKNKRIMQDESIEVDSRNWTQE